MGAGPSGPALRLVGAATYDGPIGRVDTYNGRVAKGRFHLTFPEHLIQEPVIYNVGKQFDLVTNIRRANVEDRFGWVILEMEGADDVLRDAVGWLSEQGIQVENLGGAVEG